MNKQTDLNIMKNNSSVIPPTHIIWHFVSESSELISRLFNHKIWYVTETRQNEIGITKWTGEFDNDEYFLVISIGETIVAACGEHEMMLAHNIQTVAYTDEANKILEIKNEIIRFTEMCKLQKSMNMLKFNDIMSLFKWEYVSPNTEIFSYIS